MSVEWGAYSPFDPGVTQSLHEVAKREARAAFNRLMAAKDERMSELRELLERGGVALSTDNAGLQAANDWFRGEVEGDAASGRLRNQWYAVVNDLALFLGDVMIERSPNLKWVMFDKGTRDVAFQRHVIMGFSGVATRSTTLTSIDCSPHMGTGLSWANPSRLKPSSHGSRPPARKRSGGGPRDERLRRICARPVNWTSPIRVWEAGSWLGSPS